MRAEATALALERLLPADLAGLKPGRMRYSFFTDAKGPPPKRGFSPSLHGKRLPLTVTALPFITPNYKRGVTAGKEGRVLKFTEDHEWLKLDGDIATIGITAHATELLGDIVFVQLPDLGTKLAKGDSAAVVESVKAASDVYAPLAGEVVEINQAIVDDPATVNADPQGQGWFFKMKLADAKAMDSLMDEGAYMQLIE